MAKASLIVGKHMIIPSLTTFHPEEDINWVKIDQEVNAGMIANPCNECRKTIVPKFSKPDIKLLCHNIHEFFNIADGILALTWFEYYQQTWGALPQDTWDAIVTAGDLTTGAASPVSVAGFCDCLDVFIA